MVRLTSPLRSDKRGSGASDNVARLEDFNDDYRRAEIERIVSDATPIVQRIAMLEDRQRQRLAWLVANEGDSRYDARKRIYDEGQERVDFYKSYWVIYARSARVNALRMSDSARAELISLWLDFSGCTGDGEESLYKQWRHLFEHVNLEPCPF